MQFKRILKSASLVAAASGALLASSARADDGWMDDRDPTPPKLEEEDRVRIDEFVPGNGLYVGQGTHVRLGLGVGMNFGDGATAFGLQPAISGRFRINPTLGIVADVPFLYANLSVDGGGESSSRFEIGNVSLGVEYSLDELASTYSRLRFQVALPTMSRPEFNVFDESSFEDAIMQGVNATLGAGANGLLELWRYLPDTFGVSAEFLAEGQTDEVYLAVGGGLGFLIPTGDDGDFEMLMQLTARMGYGTDIIGFGGLTMVIIPTETNVGLNNSGDAFQLGLQAGGIFKVGKGRIDIFAQLNLDNPAGFSFSDEGVFGLHAAGTIPF